MRAAPRSSRTASAILLLLSQAAVILAGYCIHVALARILGPADYGLFGIAYNALYVITLLVATGVPPAVSRLVATDLDHAAAALTEGLQLQGLLALSAAAVYALGAGMVATLLDDPSLETYIRVSALVIPGHALLYLLAGYLGGHQLFARQAFLTSAYSLFRVVSVLSLASLAGVVGGMVGLGIAPFAASLLGFVLLPSSKGYGRRGARHLAEGLVAAAVPLTAIVAGSHLLLSLDLLLLKALTDLQLAIGYYTAATTVGRTPYFLLTALGGMMLPVISQSLRDGLIADARRLIRQVVRAVVVASVPVVALLAVQAEQVVHLLFSAEYAAAKGPLPLLTAAACLAGLFSIAASIEAGGRNELRAMWVLLLSVCLGGLLGILLIPSYGMMGAAWTGVATSACAGISSLAIVLRSYRVALPYATLARSVVAVIPVALVLLWLSPSPTASPFALVAGGLAYVLALVALGELEPNDWDAMPLRALSAALARSPGRGKRQER